MAINLSDYSSVFILTDENIAPFWLPEVCEWLHCPKAIEIIIKPGEQQKNLRTVQRIWNKLLKHNADRHSLLVNLGGGVISDMGGFAASCFKRGIDFINIPTTLLAMVDASVGGKRVSISAVTKIRLELSLNLRRFCSIQCFSVLCLNGKSFPDLLKC